jgi:hypothetical protein
VDRFNAETVSWMLRMGVGPAKKAGTPRKRPLPDLAANLPLASKESDMTYWLILSATFAVAIFLTACLGFCLVAGLGWAMAGGRWHRPRGDSWMTIARPRMMRAYDHVSRWLRPYTGR